MMCNSQCPNCGACLVDAAGDGAEMKCPRCRATYGGGK